ncbi:MAG: hypothetical protein QNJ84_13065 [Alphaproteobacteria bacterium]|nr:hypothetical protein [Alphaproteobacteria bacterium]
MMQNEQEARRLLDSALVKLEQDDPAAAIAMTEQALVLTPQSPMAVHILGLTAMRMQELLRAEELFRLAHDLASDAHAHCEALAIVSARLGRLQDALFFGKMAGAMPPDADTAQLLPTWFGSFEDALYSMDRGNKYEAARKLLDAGDLAQAVDAFRAAAEADPKDQRCWRGLRDSLFFDGRPFDALLAGQALSSGGAPEPEDLSRAASILTTMGKLEEAQACHIMAVEQRPADAVIRSALIADLAVTPSVSIDELRKSERLWEISFARERVSPEPHDSSILRVGLLSGNLVEGRGLEAIWPLFSARKAAGVEVHVYSSTLKQNSLSRRVAEEADGYTDIRRLDDMTSARILANEELDILIDLDGHAAGGRPGLVAAHPARRAVRWFGVPDPESRVFDAWVGMDGVTSADGSKVPLSGVLVPTAPRAALNPTRSLGDVLSIGVAAGARKLDRAAIMRMAELAQAQPRASFVLNAEGLGGATGVDELENALNDFGLLDRVVYSPLGDALAGSIKNFIDASDLVLDPGPDGDVSVALAALSVGRPICVFSHGAPVNLQVVSLLLSLGLQDSIAQNEDALWGFAAAICANPDTLEQASAVLCDRMNAYRANDEATALSEGFLESLRQLAE